MAGGKSGKTPRRNLPTRTVRNLRKISRVQERDMHCKDKILKFPNKYSQKRNIGVSVPISTFMRLWVIYTFQRSVCLFCWRKYVDRSRDYINRSQTHEYGKWGWGRAIPRKGIHKWDFRCSVGRSWRYSAYIIIKCYKIRGVSNSATMFKIIKLKSTYTVGTLYGVIERGSRFYAVVFFG